MQIFNAQCSTVEYHHQNIVKVSIGVNPLPVVLFINILTGNSHILAGYQLAQVEQRSTAIVRSLAPTGEAAFEQLFKMHFRGLHAYAITILKDETMAEEIVQNVFYKFWEKENNSLDRNITQSLSLQSRLSRLP